MSTEDVTKDHIQKMLMDAKAVAGCDKFCKHTVSESDDGSGTRFFTITHESDKAIDSHTIPAMSMSLMEENTLANFLLARHETTRAARAAARD